MKPFVIDLFTSIIEFDVKTDVPDIAFHADFKIKALDPS